MSVLDEVVNDTASIDAHARTLPSAARGQSPTPRQLAMLLALSALPVALTTTIMRSLRLVDVASSARGSLHPSYLAFVVDALANWLTFAIVVRVAGRAQLAAHGLRFPIDGKRLAAG